MKEEINQELLHCEDLNTNSLKSFFKNVKRLTNSLKNNLSARKKYQATGLVFRWIDNINEELKQFMVNHLLILSDELWKYALLSEGVDLQKFEEELAELNKNQLRAKENNKLEEYCFEKELEFETQLKTVPNILSGGLIDSMEDNEEIKKFVRPRRGY